MIDHPRRPITALRRIEADQTLLRIEVRELCQQVARFDEGVQQCRQDLEALAQLFKQEFKQRERLLELQEGFDESAMNLPEAFAETKGQYYERIVNVDLGAVHKALIDA